jgi:hypothetical protein
MKNLKRIGLVFVLVTIGLFITMSLLAQEGNEKGDDLMNPAGFNYPFEAIGKEFIIRDNPVFPKLEITSSVEIRLKVGIMGKDVLCLRAFGITDTKESETTLTINGLEVYFPHDETITQTVETPLLFRFEGEKLQEEVTLKDGLYTYSQSLKSPYFVYFLRTKEFYIEPQKPADSISSGDSQGGGYSMMSGEGESYSGDTTPPEIYNLIPASGSTIGNSLQIISADYRDVSPLPGWNYRSAISITNSTAVSLTNYQVPITLTNLIYDNSNLVVSYHFSDVVGTNSPDSSGNYKNSTLVHSPVTATGKFGTGISLDGSYDYIYLGDGTTGINNLDKSFSIDVWVYPFSSTGYYYIMGTGDGNSNHASYFTAYVDYHTPGQFYFVVEAAQDSSKSKYIYSSTGYSANQWHHVVATYDGSTKALNLYINGSLDNASSGGSISGNANAYDFWTIGNARWVSGTYDNYYFPGKIDEAKIYSRVLSGTEALEHYNAATPTLTKGCADYADIRFYSGVTSCSYWLESDIKAWVEVPLLVNLTNTTIYMYSGNVSATAESNANNTFLFFDDFPGSSISTTIWTGNTGYATVANGICTFTSLNTTIRKIYTNSTFTSPVAFRSLHKYGVMTTGSASQVCGFASTDGNKQVSGYADLNNTFQEIIYNSPYYAYPNTNWTVNAYVVAEQMWDKVTPIARWFENGIEKTASPYITGTYIATIALPVLFQTRRSSTYIDWALVRNYTYNEPLTTIYSMESITSTEVNTEDIDVDIDGTPVSITAYSHTVSYTPTTPFELGTHYVSVTITDLANNSVTTSWPFTVVDSIPPRIFNLSPAPNSVISNAWTTISANYNDGFLRRPITITNSGPALTDYQILITPSYNANMQSDFDDLRFRDSADNELSYWLESKVDSISATIWVKVPVITEYSTTTIYMYYGPTYTTSASNGNATFDFFDDFNDITAWTESTPGQWSVENGILQSPDSGTPYYLYRTNPLASDYKMEARIYIQAESYEGSTEADILLNATDVNQSTGYKVHACDSIAGGQRNWLSGDYNESIGTTISDFPAFTWLKMTFTPTTKEAELLTDDRVSYGTDIRTSSYAGTIMAMLATYSKYQCDWILIHKYTSNGLTITIGAEENAPNFASGIDINLTTIIVKGQNVTEYAYIDEYGISYTPDWPFENGPVTVTITAGDILGNVSTSTHTFIVDTIDPTGTITPGHYSVFSDTIPTLAGVFTDVNGIASFTVVLNGVDVTDKCVTTTNSFTYTPDTSLLYQNYITATVIDNAGHISYFYYTFFFNQNPCTGFETNDEHHIADPVYISTGEFYQEVTDLTIPGIGMPFKFTRKYRSLNTLFDSPIGYAWDFNYNRKISMHEEEDGSLDYFDGTGRYHIFEAPVGGVYTPPSDLYVDLTYDDDNNIFYVEETNGTTYKFENIDSETYWEYHLTLITDRNGNKITLNYDEVTYMLTSITDTLTRTINFVYTGSRIDYILDWSGRIIDFTYDGNGDLINVASPTTTVYANGNVVTYTYTSGYTGYDVWKNHKMLTIKDPKGQQYLSAGYNDDGRIITQTYGTETFYFTYTEETSSEPRKVFVTDRNGNETEYWMTPQGNVSKRIQYTNGTMPDDVITLYEHITSTERSKTIFPNGNSIEYTYAITSTDPRARGNLTQIKRISGSTELTTNYTYETHYNLVKTITDLYLRHTSEQMYFRGKCQVTNRS